MAKTHSDQTPKTWKPGDKLSFDKATRKDVAPDHITDGAVRTTEALPPQFGSAKHPVAPTNHKPFNRQKKG